MKTLLATAALAMLLSSSAHAQYGVWRGDYRLTSTEGGCPPARRPAGLDSARKERGRVPTPPLTLAKCELSFPERALM